MTDAPNDSIDRISILVVDDDASCLKAVARILGRVPGRTTRVLTACGAEEAEAFARRERVDVAVCDFHLAGRSGLAFLRRLREIAPAARRVVLTGDRDSRAVRDATFRGDVDAVLAKPFALDELRDAVAGLAPV